MSYGTALDNIASDFIILENFVQRWSDSAPVWYLKNCIKKPLVAGPVVEAFINPKQ